MARAGLCGMVWLLAAVAAGCTPASSSGADAGPDPLADGGDAEPDGSTTSGLVLEFVGDPEVPASLGGEYSAVLSEVDVVLQEVRAIGDAAPGDDRTTREEVQIEWRSGEDDEEEPEDDGSNNDPVRVVFGQAPPGLYSLVLAQVKSYRLRGTVVVDSVSHPFDLDDHPVSPLPISIALGGVDLEPGSIQDVIIGVSTASAVLAATWSDVTPDPEGELRIDKNSSQIAGIRAQIEDAFQQPADAEIE